jgi:hypothetical protein
MTVLIVSGKSAARVPPGISFHREHPNAPLTISTIERHSVFSQSPLIPGLTVLKLNEKDATWMSPEEADALLQPVPTSGLFSWTTTSEATKSITISAEGFIGKIVRDKKSENPGIVLKESMREKGILIATIKEDSKFQETELKEGMKVVSINGSPCPEKAMDAIRMIQNTVGKLKVVAVHSKRKLNAVALSTENGTAMDSNRAMKSTKVTTSTQALEEQAIRDAVKNAPPKTISPKKTSETEEKAMKRAAKRAECRKPVERKTTEKIDTKAAAKEAIPATTATSRNISTRKTNSKKEKTPKAATQQAVSTAPSPEAANASKREVVMRLNKLESRLNVSPTMPQSANKGVEMMKRLDKLELSLHALESSVKQSNDQAPAKSEASFGIKSIASTQSEVFHVDEEDADKVRSSKDSVNSRRKRSKSPAVQKKKSSKTASRKPNKSPKKQAKEDQKPLPSASAKVLEVDDGPLDKKPAKTPFRLFKMSRAPIELKPSESHTLSEVVDLDRCEGATLLPSATKEMDVDQGLSPTPRKVDFTGQVHRVVLTPAPSENANENSPTHLNKADLDRCEGATLLPSVTKEMDVDQDLSPTPRKVAFIGQVHRSVLTPAPSENANENSPTRVNKAAAVQQNTPVQDDAPKQQQESPQATRSLTGLSFLKKKEQVVTVTVQKISADQIVGIGFTHSTEHSPLKIAALSDDGIFGESILAKGLVVKEINGKDMTWAYPIVAANEIKQATGYISITVDGVVPNASKLESERQERSLFAGKKYKKTNLGDYLQLESTKEDKRSGAKPVEADDEVAEIEETVTGDAECIDPNVTTGYKSFNEDVIHDDEGADHAAEDIENDESDPVKEQVRLLEEPMFKEEEKEGENSRRSKKSSMKKGLLTELKLFSFKRRVTKKQGTKRVPVDPERQLSTDVVPIRVDMDTEAAKARHSDKAKDEREVESGNVKARITKTSKDDRLGFKVVKYKNRRGIFLSQIDENSELQNSNLKPGMRITKINDIECPDNIQDMVFLVKSITGTMEIQAIDINPKNMDPKKDSEKAPEPTIFSSFEGTVSSLFESVFVSSPQ